MFDYPQHLFTPRKKNDGRKFDEKYEMKKVICKVVGLLTGIVIGLAICALIGCAPKVSEEIYHHYEQADTLAIQAQVDKQLKSWHEQMESSWRQRMEEYSASLFSNEDQKEKVTETITTWTDSLGREMRQEQRTTERSLSRMQQQTEQRLSREFEQRMSVAVDSLNDIWQQRFDALQAHFEQTDSTNSHVQSGSAAFGELPWYKRWWQTLKDIIIGAVIAALLYLTRNLWLKLFKR